MPENIRYVGHARYYVSCNLRTVSQYTPCMLHALCITYTLYVHVVMAWSCRLQTPFWRNCETIKSPLPAKRQTTHTERPVSHQDLSGRVQAQCREPALCPQSQLCCAGAATPWAVLSTQELAPQDLSAPA